MTYPVLVGSRALAYWDPTFKLKDDADWDIICDPRHDYLFEGMEKVDISRPEDLHSQAFIDRWVTSGILSVGGVELKVLTPNGLAAMKRSHLWRDYNFEKHILQYHLHLKPWLGFNDEGWSLIRERERLTKLKYPQGNPSLAQTNDDFFDDAVDKKFDHDWLHELYAYGDAPVYTKMKRDDSKAWCEKDMWEDFDHTTKIQCVAEECYVIATERFMVPKDWKYPSKLAYLKALQKVCTTLTSGWFRDYAIDNYWSVREQYDEGKFNEVKEKLT